MRKILTVLFACLFAVLCLSACGKGVQKPDPSPSQSEEAAAVELLICGLPQAGIPSEGLYLAAKERFDALTEREQRSVSNADKLTDGLAEIVSCKRILAVSEAIDALPEVQSLTQADDGDILAARAAYDALTEAERPRVGNYGKLIEAELCRGMVPTLDGMQSIYRYDGIAGGKLAFRVDDFVELYREGMPKAEEGVSYENGILTLSAEYMNALTYGVSRFEAVTSSGSSIAFKILKYSDNYRFFDADTLVYNTPDGNNIARPRVVDSGIDGKSFEYDFAGKENGTYIIAYDSNGNLGIEKFDCKKDHTYLFQFDIEMLDEPLSESNNFILTFEYLFNVLYQRRSNSLYVENRGIPDTLIIDSATAYAEVSIRYNGSVGNVRLLVNWKDRDHSMAGFVLHNYQTFHALVDNILFLEVPDSPDTVKVDFDSQGGSAVPSQKTKLGQKLPEPAAPVRAGYVFDGWYREAECLTPWNFSADTVDGSMTLYAGWLRADGTLGGSVSLFRFESAAPADLVLMKGEKTLSKLTVNGLEMGAGLIDSAQTVTLSASFLRDLPVGVNYCKAELSTGEVWLFTLLKDVGSDYLFFDADNTTAYSSITAPNIKPPSSVADAGIWGKSYAWDYDETEAGTHVLIYNKNGDFGWPAYTFEQNTEYLVSFDVKATAEMPAGCYLDCFAATLQLVYEEGKWLQVPGGSDERMETWSVDNAQKKASLVITQMGNGAAHIQLRLTWKDGEHPQEGIIMRGSTSLHLMLDNVLMMKVQNA